MLFVLKKEHIKWACDLVGCLSYKKVNSLHIEYTFVCLSSEKPYGVSWGNQFKLHKLSSKIGLPFELNLCNILIKLKLTNASSPQLHKDTIECIASSPILSIWFLFISVSPNRMKINKRKLNAIVQFSFQMPH
jgi:hypothetical protein